MWSEVISCLIAFSSTLLITPLLARFLYQVGIVGLDLHKRDKPKLPSAGGLAVACGVVAGLLSYVGIKTFVYGLQQQAIHLLAAISSLLIITFIGFMDDLNVKKRKIEIKSCKDIRIGLPQWLKPLLTLPAAIPLMVTMAGHTTMNIPLLGSVDFGILYPLILVPIGVVGASNAVNLLGGFNGVEAGMGIVYTLALGIYALTHESIAAVIFLVSFASLLAFLPFNWYPAKILPGDSLTYLLGSVVATGVIIGNMEKIGMMVLAPFIIEFFLKARSKFKASCLGKLRKDGRLDPPYGKEIYSLTHLILQFHPTEKQVTLSLIVVVALFSALALLDVKLF